MKTQKWSDAEILESMRTRGGGFAAALAEACLQADEWNLRKIKTAFSELWQEHAELLELDLKKAFDELWQEHAESDECLGQ